MVASHLGSDPEQEHVRVGNVVDRHEVEFRQQDHPAFQPRAGDRKLNRAKVGLMPYLPAKRNAWSGEWMLFASRKQRYCGASCSLEYIPAFSGV